MEMNIFLLLTNIFVFVLGGGLFMIMPQITRKSYLFGVRIPPEEAGCDSAVQMRKRYVKTCLFGMLILLAVCVAWYVFWPEHMLLATLYMPLVLVPISFAAYVPNWRKAVRLKEERGWAVSNARFADTSRSARGDLSAIPWGWYVASFVLVIASAAVAVYRFPNLPELIPVHFDAAGVATRYAEPTWLYVLLAPLVNAPWVLIMLAVNIVIQKSKMQIDQNNPALSFAQHRIYRRRMGNALGIMCFAFVVVMTPIFLPMLFPDAAWASGLMRVFTMIVLVISFILPAPLIVAFLRSGQGGHKIKVDLPEEIEPAEPAAQQKITGRGDDKYWFLGMFYYNPEDPTLFIEDRFGINFDFNYARPAAKIGVAIIVLGTIALYVWATISLT